MSEKKKLTQEEQLKQDIASYNLQIVQLNNRINQLAGAKSYAERMLKRLKEDEDAVQCAKERK